MPAVSPPASIIGRAPKRSTTQPTSGPPALPSARARLNTSDICDADSPNSVWIGVKKRGNPCDMEPLPNIPKMDAAVITHHP